MRFLRTRRYCVRNATHWRRPKTIAIAAIVVAITNYALYSILYIYIIMTADFRQCVNGDNAYEHAYIHKEGRNRVVTLNCIPRAPDFASRTKRVIPLATHLSEPFLRLPKQMVYTQRIVILSPIRDESARLELFANLLSTLSYPHHLISVHFGEDGSHDDTVDVAKSVSHRLVHTCGFSNATVVKLKIKGNNTNRRNRHHARYQMERRSNMAKARNLLMEYGLRNEEWILWIDCDVISFRADVIQQFLYSNKDVMVATALSVSTFPLLFSTFRFYTNYDLNTYRDSFHNDTRIWLFDLKAEGREVPIEFVGGCTLMLRADCYRKGLRFAEVPYKPIQIKGGGQQTNMETEGMAKMARDLGMSVYGLPHLEVIHE